MSSVDSSSSMASLIALFQSLPPGADAFTYLRVMLNSQVYTKPEGYFLGQAYFFIAVHAFIILLAVAGCFVRVVKGNFWLFSIRNELYFPNTSVLSQLCFLGYSTLYIVSIATTELKPSTTSAYGISVSCFIFLGLAIHLQAWATLYARPRSSLSLSTPQPASNATHQLNVPRCLRGIGPRTMNALMIGIAALFLSSIIIGRVVCSIPRAAMMGALDTIDVSLAQAAATNASPESLLTLVPVFEVFLTQGAKLGSTEIKIVKVWIVWAVVWFLMYLPPAISLVRTLIKQETQLKRTIDNLDALDAVETTVHPTETLPKSPTPTSARPFRAFRPSTADSAASKSSSFTSLDASPALIGVPAPRSRTAPQKQEIGQKLKAVRKMKGVIASQLGTTFVMLVIYSAIAIFSLLPWTATQPRDVITHVSNTWLGWAFIIPGTFSAAFFLYTSLRAPSTHPIPLGPRPNSTEEIKEEDETKAWRSPPLHSTSITFAGSAENMEMSQSRSSIGDRSIVSSSGGACEDARAGLSSWVPSRWAREKEDGVEGLAH